MGQPAWRGVASRCGRACALRKPRRASAHCVHNVHQLNRYTTPKKHPSVRRRRIKVDLCQLVTGFPLAALIYANGVARKANYRIIGNCLTIEEMRKCFSRLYLYLFICFFFLFRYIYLFWSRYSLLNFNPDKRRN